MGSSVLSSKQSREKVDAGLPMGAKKLRTTYPESGLDVLVGGHLREASLEEDLSARREHLESARVQNA